MPTWVPDWFLDWAHSVTLFDLLLWVVAGVGIVLFIRKGWPWLRKTATAITNFATIVDSVQGLPAFIKRTDDGMAAQSVTLAEHTEKIDGIYHETHKNDGSSIKDATVRLEEGVKGLYQEIANLRDADQSIRAEFQITRTTEPSSEVPKRT
jgi:hypothetical protein